MMKLFLGVGDVGSILNEWAEGFRKQNIFSKTAVHTKSPFFPRNRYDIDLSRFDKKILGKEIPAGGYSNKQVFPKAFNLGSRFLQTLFLVSSFDAFLFVTPSLSVFKPDFDFSLIKRLKKKLIIVCVGTDIRHISGFVQEFPCSEMLFDDQFKNDPIERPLSNLRRAELYSDLIYSVPDQSSLGIRDYMHWHIPIKVEDYKFNVPDREEPVIVHAPSRRGIKGTDQILGALEQLKNEGFRFELRLLEKVSNQVVREHLTEADILVDEMVLHGPGILSLEAMASGCCVSTKYLETSPDFFKPPVYAINENTVYEKLKLLLTNRQLRKEMAIKGREYVEKNNHPDIVSKKFMTDLEAANKGTLQFDYKAEFFKLHYQLPNGTTLSPKLKKMNLQLAKKYWSDFKEHEAYLRQRNLI
jgi:glycosyltransferase involved in cell wall biosynthesis